MVNILKTWLNEKGALQINGDLFHTRYTAHIINLIVKNGLEVVSPLLKKIHNSVKYVNSLTYRNQKFKKALKHTRLSTRKRVSLNVDTRWNSTYLMLQNVLDTRDVFERMAELDSDYKYYQPKNNGKEEDRFAIA